MAFPILLARLEVILRDFVVEQSLTISETGERALISDVMCVLEVREPMLTCSCHDTWGLSAKHTASTYCRLVQVLATMTLSPLVVDAVTDRYKSVVPLLEHVRHSTASGHGFRERAHLLFLYPLVIECVCAREQRVRDMLRDVLRLTAAELGLSNAPVAQ